MKIVTVVSDQNDFGFNNILVPSTRVHDLELIALYPGEYKNHRTKLSALNEYLNHVNDDEVIFFTDGYDTMFMTGEKEILDKYYRRGKKILFSAEFVCWPEPELSNRFPIVNDQFRYLNSGGFIGIAGYIKERITENLQTDAISKHFWCDQIYWTEQFLLNSGYIGLDNECEIFSTLVSSEDINLREKIDAGNFDWQMYINQKILWFRRTFEFADNRILNIQNRNQPCHIHFNGWSKVLVKEVIENLSVDYKYELLAKQNQIMADIEAGQRT